MSVVKRVLAPKLFWVAGPSGAGKDTVMAWVRDHLPEAEPLVFAHRYITRAAQAGSENHVALSAQEFALRLQHGLFVADWQAHGLRYGIGIEVRDWMARGLSVVVNGSREYLPRARAAFPDLVFVHITAPAAVLVERLRSRKREDEMAIAARIQRNAGLSLQRRADDIEIINDHSVEAAGRQLLQRMLAVANV